MKTFLNKHTGIGILVLRLVLGITFILDHGLPKLKGGPESWTKLGGAMANLGINFLPTFWGFMAMASEFFGAILLLLGLFTRTSSALLAFTMIVAMTQHLSRLDPWGKVINPMTLAAVFFLLIFLGGGKYSLDALFFKEKKPILPA